MKFRYVFCLKSFLKKIINLRVIKELADFEKSSGPSPKLMPADLESKSAGRF
jgi:hypothetical protein